MTLLVSRGLLTFAKETTYGVSATDPYKALRVLRDPEITPLEADTVTREEVRPWWGNDYSSPTNRRTRIRFSVYNTGSGTAGTAPQFASFLLAAGFNEAKTASVSVAYNLVSQVDDSLTINWATADTSGKALRHKLLGARVENVTLGANVGQFPTIEFDVIGLYTQPDDLQAMPTATFENQADPFPITAANTPTVTIDGVANCMAEFELSLNSEIDAKNYAGCSQRIDLTDRKPDGRIQIEEKLIAGQNIYGLVVGTTLPKIEWTHSGGGNGNTVKVTVQKAKLNAPTKANRNNSGFLNIPFTPYSTDGTSEITLLYT